MLTLCRILVLYIIVYYILFFSDSQGSGLLHHFGPRRSNSSIHTYPQKCTQHCGEIEIIPFSRVLILLFKGKLTAFLYFQNLDDSDWTNSLYTSPISAVENTSFFTQDISNLSSALLKEDDPGEAGGWLRQDLVLCGVKELLI